MSERKNLYIPVITLWLDAASFVIPANAGIQIISSWTPAFAGVT